METVKISEFKAKCIDALKRVRDSGEPLVVTLRNQPIATVTPFQETTPTRRLGALRGRMQIHADIVHTDGEDDWEMEGLIVEDPARSPRVDLVSGGTRATGP